MAWKSYWLGSLLLIAGFLLPAVPGWAQGGPPLMTDDPGTPGKGKWEINLAGYLEQDRESSLFWAPDLDLNYGPSENIQLKFEMPYVLQQRQGNSPRSGAGNAVVGLKWRFYGTLEEKLAVSVYPQLEFNPPTSSAAKGLVDAGTQFFMPLEMSLDLEKVNFAAELGYITTQNGHDGWFWGIVLDFEPVEELDLLAEIHGSAPQDFNPELIVANLGFRCNINETSTLLLSAGRRISGIQSGEPTLMVYAGWQLHLQPGASGGHSPSLGLAGG